MLKDLDINKENIPMKLLFMHLSDLHLSKYDDINEDAIAGIAQTLSSQNIGSISHVRD